MYIKASLIEEGDIILQPGFPVVVDEVSVSSGGLIIVRADGFSFLFDHDEAVHMKDKE